MCVIIYIPENQTISYDELKSAWHTNPDGAGYAMLRDGNIIYHRGFMTFGGFYDEIKSKIGKHPLLLHFRITTSSCINQVQTHPYELGSKRRLKGITTNPVICMNGIINGQEEYKGFNDTMSYIKDHPETFQLIGHLSSQELLDLIESDTGSKWAIMTVNGVLLSSEFLFHEGKFYSNLNHIQIWTYEYKPEISFKTQIKTRKLRNLIYKDKALLAEVLDHIEFNCQYGQCFYCTKCLTNCYTLKQVKKALKGKYF